MYVEAFHASSPLELAKGMRGRSSGVMLLEFPELGKHSLDMALVPRSLYLYFLDEDGQVIETGRASTWSWDPRTWESYKPQRAYKYVVESFHPLVLEKGDTVDLLHFHKKKEK